MVTSRVSAQSTAYGESPKEWRALFQGALLTEGEPLALHESLVGGIRDRAWAALEDARGRRFRNFDDFCLVDRPHGLGSDPHRVRAFLERLLGERKAKLVLVSSSGQGERTDRQPSAHRGGKSTRQDDRLRAIAERAPASISELYCRDLLGAQEAERFGRRRLPEAAATKAQAFVRKAERLVAAGLPDSAEKRLALRKALNSEVRTIFGRTQPAIVCSAIAGTNADLIPQILDLYVKPRSRIADVTYGRGVFWRNVPPGKYELLGTDIRDGVDCRCLPYEDSSLDCVALDPPYKSNVSELGSAEFGSAYRNHERGTSGHSAIVQLYVDGAVEAHRVLRNRGTLIVKCQDEFANGRQRWTHIELIATFERLGFRSEDLFVLVQNQVPMINLNSGQQRHARKNHSYALVFRKTLRASVAKTT
jgi:hypothetical protein